MSFQHSRSGGFPVPINFTNVSSEDELEIEYHVLCIP